MRRNLLRGLCLLALICLIFAVSASSFTHGGDTPPVTGQLAPANVNNDGGLTVMSLNVAHGRADGFHQLFTTAEHIESNLNRIGRLAQRESVDLLALQEVDGPSPFSARIEAAAHIAELGGQSHYVRGRHTIGLGLDYGTAVLSRLPVRRAASQTFKPTPPTFTKGFTLSTVEHPNSPTGAIDVVSVHLDFARHETRAAQLLELIEALESRPHPRILMGDFNTEWADGLLPQLATVLGLKTWRPQANDITFDALETRIDWILVSEKVFDFAEHRVLAAGFSDHRPVVARLVFGHEKH